MMSLKNRLLLHVVAAVDGLLRRHFPLDDYPDSRWVFP